MEKNIFDKVANFYEEIFPEYIFNHYLNKRIDFFKKNFPDKYIKILDVGCGTGIFLEKLKERGYDNVWGIDISGEMVKIANKRLPERILKGSITFLPFPSESFDLVSCIAVLHHLASKNKIEKAFEEISRVLKKGGYILIWEHNPLNPYWNILMKKVPQDTGEEKLVSSCEINRYLKENKIKIIKQYRKGFVPDFIPPSLLPLFKFLEKGLEKIFPLNLLMAHNVIIGEKN